MKSSFGASRVRRLIAASLAAGLGLVAFGASVAAQTVAPAVGAPGRFDAITDVPGIEVGQVQSAVKPYLTGLTVVYLPRMSVAGVSQLGGAPATRETDLLRPTNSNPGVNAILLGGSSMYGLTAAAGIYRWLEDHGQGYPVGKAGVAPIVPGADIFDLDRGGNPKARTSPAWGYLAMEAASGGPVRQGVVGGGTGALAGGFKSGVGSASEYLGHGIYVGAIVVANPAGSTVDPRTCAVRGVQYGLDGEFAGVATPTAAECRAHPVHVFATVQQAGGATAPHASHMNTTIAVVATNAPLSKAAAQRMAEDANDGMARAIDPIHTLVDGDTIFAVSTGRGAPLAPDNLRDLVKLSTIFHAASRALSRAIAKAVLSATPIDGYQSYCSTYPSACARARQVQLWRSGGHAPGVTQAALRKASAALKLVPVP